jgi:hypothetical protein
MNFVYTNYKGNTRQQVLTFSLATIFVISSISFLVQINSIENAGALVDYSNTTIISELPNLLQRDLLTGQVIDDLKPGDSLIEDEKDQNLGLNLEDFKGGLTWDNSIGARFMDNNLFLNLQNDNSKTISNILDNSSEVIDWIPFESIIAVKVDKNNLDPTPYFINVHVFINNQDKIISSWEVDESKLYKFVHFPVTIWQAPAIPIDVILSKLGGGEANYTKSSMCNTYLEMSKFYKCNITIQ